MEYAYHSDEQRELEIKQMMSDKDLHLKFLWAIQAKEYDPALQLARLILKIEPENKKIIEFESVLVQFIQKQKDEEIQFGFEESSDEEEENEDDSYDDEDHEEEEDEQEEQDQKQDQEKNIILQQEIKIKAKKIVQNELNQKQQSIDNIKQKSEQNSISQAKKCSIQIQERIQKPEIKIAPKTTQNLQNQTKLFSSQSTKQIIKQPVNTSTGAVKQTIKTLTISETQKQLIKPKITQPSTTTNSKQIQKLPKI